MKFEKLNENKLRITLNIKDLAQENIDYQSFMSNSIDTQKLFSEMLEKAEKEVGFETKNYKIMIEALVTSNGDFVVTVTRSLPNDSTSVTKKRTLKPKRKNISSIKQHLIYSFSSFDDFCLFCNSLDEDIINNIHKISKKISLFTMNDKYFLIIDNIKKDFIYTRKFISSLSEFSKYVNNSNIVEYKLREYGKVIFENNSIKKCINYFK